MVQLADQPDVLKMADRIYFRHPGTVVSVRLNLSPDSPSRILELSRLGLKVFHLCADQHGRERTGNSVPGQAYEGCSPRAPHPARQ